jgi:hypothetical protein
LPLAKVGGELFAHLGERTVTVGLEEEQQAPRRCGECSEGRGDLVGIVGEVVDDGDATCRADGFKATLEPGKPAERFGSLAEVKA